MCRLPFVTCTDSISVPWNTAFSGYPVAVSLPVIWPFAKAQAAKSTPRTTRVIGRGRESIVCMGNLRFTMKNRHHSVKRQMTRYLIQDRTEVVHRCRSVDETEPSHPEPGDSRNSAFLPRRRHH